MAHGHYRVPVVGKPLPVFVFVGEARSGIVSSRRVPEDKRETASIGLDDSWAVKVSPLAVEFVKG